MPNKPSKSNPSPLRKINKELTAGGIVYRLDPKTKIEFLLIQDIKDRWTIPKGHVEEGESYQQTALREITEETGLKELRKECYLKPIRFNYRHGPKLVIMVLHLFAVEALGDTDQINCEEWSKDIAWVSTNQALERIAYQDLYQAILLTLNHLRQQNKI